MIDISIKVVLLGGSSVGKTSLVRRFVENTFVESDDYASTIGGAFTSKEVFSNNKGKVLLNIWDTAGEEKYESVTRSFYRDSNAAIVCYDVTCERSWKRAKSWITELRQFEENCVIYLCATKKDLQDDTSRRAVPINTLNSYVTDMNIKKHFLTSSKQAENVVDVFHTIAQDFVETHQNEVSEYENIKIGTTNSQRRKRSCCFK